MKKLLFCAGVLALMASCAQYDVDSVAVEKSGKGIVFEASAVEDATRGGFANVEVDGKAALQPFWYAEQDQIAIWADNAILGNPGTTTGGNGRVAEFYGSKYAAYKATKSAVKGEFTSVVLGETWNFNRNTKASGNAKLDSKGNVITSSNFFAVYPAALATTTALTKPGDNKVFTVTMEDNLTANTQTDAMGAGVYEKLVKWSYSSADPEAAYDAVGEKVNLDFQREMVDIVFQTKGYDNYAEVFGALQTISLEAQGYTDPEDETGKSDIDASTLTLGTDATLVVTIDKNNEAKSELTIGEDPASKVTTTIGFDWSDKANAHMVITPVSHEEFIEAEKSETFVATYTFENITFSTTVPTAGVWNAGAFIGFPVLDVTDPNKYPYFVVGSGNDKTLIVNKYSASMFGSKKNDTTNTWVVWPIGAKEGDANADWANATQFKSIISVDAWGADLTKIAKFTNLTSLELDADVTLPKDMLKNIAVTKLIAPEVTSIDPAFTNKNLAMVDLELPKYDFAEANNDIRTHFFAASAASLVTLDIAATTTFESKFSETGVLSFKNFDALKTVTLNENGTYVKSEAFAECDALETIKGKVNINGLGVEAVFMNSPKLNTVEITSTVIPANSFKGCTALTGVTVNGAAIAPTSIGKRAFDGCTNLVTMDLSKATVIESYAFNGCSKFTGIKDAEKAGNYLTVPVTTVRECAFQGTAIVYVKFPNATKIQPGIFNNATKLKHVQFDQVFTCELGETTIADGSRYWKNAFSETPGDVTLYVNSAQATVKQNTLTINWATGSGNNVVNHTCSWTFANIAELR